MQNGELRALVRTLRIKNAKLGGDQAGKKGKDKARTRALIPPAYHKFAAEIHLAGRKAAYSLSLWIEENWFMYKRKPSLNYKDPAVRYESLASQQAAMATRTWDYLQAQEGGIDLTTFISSGNARWFWKVVSSLLLSYALFIDTTIFDYKIRQDAQDSKSKLLDHSVEALPRVVPLIVGPKSARLVSKASARRNDPILKVLRGRCFEHFPPIYYPPGTDLTNPESKRTLFLVPQIGYVSPSDISQTHILIYTIQYYRAALYGPSSIYEPRLDSWSNGVKWKAALEGVTPTNLALMFVMVRSHVYLTITVR